VLSVGGTEQAHAVCSSRIICEDSHMQHMYTHSHNMFASASVSSVPDTNTP
jgi:hypothetical protein